LDAFAHVDPTVADLSEHTHRVGYIERVTTDIDGKSY